MFYASLILLSKIALYFIVILFPWINIFILWPYVIPYWLDVIMIKVYDIAELYLAYLLGTIFIVVWRVLVHSIFLYNAKCKFYLYESFVDCSFIYFLKLFFVLFYITVIHLFMLTYFKIMSLSYFLGPKFWIQTLEVTDHYDLFFLSCNMFNLWTLYPIWFFE